jgi:hypothetical protein
VEPPRDVTDGAGEPDEPLFGLAVSPDVRAQALRQYLDQADAEDIAPFTGWTDHLRGP